MVSSSLDPSTGGVDHGREPPKEQPWLKLREDKLAGKEAKRVHVAGEVYGVEAGDLLLINGHGGKGRHVKAQLTPYE